MPLPKKINPAQFRKDPGGRAHHLYHVPTDSVYALDPDLYERIASSMPEEEEDETEEPADPELQEFEGMLDTLHQQLEEKDAEIAELTYERDQARKDLQDLKKSLTAPSATPMALSPALNMGDIQKSLTAPAAMASPETPTNAS